jgi:prepilin peptidase CpaA
LLLKYFSINDFVLIALIGAALYFDLTRKRIPNFLTFPAIIWGIISYTVMQGFEGLWFSFLGLIVGLAIFFIPFAMGGMGAGDVKLLGAVGALQGWHFVLSAFFLTALFGGVMALGYLIATRRFFQLLKKMVGFVMIPLFDFLYSRVPLEFFNRVSVFFASHDLEKTKTLYMPYGVAIAAGVIAVVVLNLSPWGELFLNSFPW